MTSEQWSRVKDLFDQAIDLSPLERESLLTDSAFTDPDITAEVRRLIRNYEDAGAFMEIPPSGVQEFREISHPISTFAPGDLVATRYQIVRLLGIGGMGEVYAAFDQEIQGLIALKTLRASTAKDGAVPARLAQEVQTAWRVTHPNVCRVYNLERHGDLVFLTMQLLEGETLSERLKRGPIPEAEAWPLIEQMSDGLCAAHAAGIVHRDFKPGNVILVADHAVITDFGLARFRDPLRLGAGSVSTDGAVIGTLPYMPPEVLGGQPAAAAADIYALGVTMYEMATGKVPFEGNALASAVKRAMEDPVSPRKLNPAISRRWEKHILRCLDRDPNARPLLPVHGRHLLPQLPRVGRLTRRAALGALLVGAGGVAVWRAYAPGPQHPGAFILISDFESAAPSEDVAAVAAAFRQQLAQSPFLNTLPRSRIETTLRYMNRDSSVPIPADVSREVAWRSGTPLVLFASVGAMGGGYALNLKMEWTGREPQRPRFTRVETFEASSRPAMLAAVQEAARWVRTVAGEPGPSVASADRPPEDVSSPSWEALIAFGKAESLQARHQTQLAMNHYVEAVAKDPDFALAHVRMGDLYGILRRPEESAAEHRAALAAAGRRRISRREELRLRGMGAFDTGEYVEADRFFEIWSREFPNDPLGYFYRVEPLVSSGRAAEALHNLSIAESLDPHEFNIPLYMGFTLLAMEQAAKAEERAVRLEQMGEPRYAGWVRGSAAFLAGRFDEAVQRFFNLRQDSEWLWRRIGLLAEANIRAELGYADQALELLESGTRAAEAAGETLVAADCHVASCWLHLRAGRRADCRAEALRAARLSTGGLHLMRAGTALARSGDVEDAARLLSHMPAEPSTRKELVNRLRLEGETALAQNRPDRATPLLEKAGSLEPLMSDHEYLAYAYRTTRRLGEALAVYQRIAALPGYLWRQPQRMLPGFWADSVAAALQLADQTTSPDTVGLQARSKFLRKASALPPLQL
jgi:tetratricopeptide (TPR) repeat protein